MLLKDATHKEGPPIRKPCEIASERLGHWAPVTLWYDA